MYFVVIPVFRLQKTIFFDQQIIVKRPKIVMTQNGVVKRLLLPHTHPSQVVNPKQNIAAAFASATIIPPNPSHITLTVQPEVSARPFLQIGRQNGTGNVVLIDTTSAGSNDVIPQISIPSPAYSHFHLEEDSGSKFNNDKLKDSFSLNISSLFDENSTSDNDAHKSSR